MGWDCEATDCTKLGKGKWHKYQVPMSGQYGHIMGHGTICMCFKDSENTAAKCDAAGKDHVFTCVKDVVGDSIEKMQDEMKALAKKEMKKSVDVNLAAIEKGVCAPQIF